MPIRIAILAGVSTDSQVEGKQSIPDQVKNCRAYILANGATETAGPYIMDGYSRTGYDSLEIALREIPPLGLAVKQSNRYDVLLMDNFDRLGDLGYILKTRFKKLGKQLHSVRQSGKLISPDIYNPYNDDSSDISMHVEGIIQTYRINKIKRGWNIGVPNRARNGLPPLNIPYAYKSTGKNSPPAIVEDQAHLLKTFKDMLLLGSTLTALQEYVRSTGLPSPRGKRWHSRVIRNMLENPYYAGQTIFGRTKTINGKKVPVPRSLWIIGDGKHIPLWDMETHLAILAEFDRRDNTRIRSTLHALTSIVHCNACGLILHHHGQKSRWQYLGCNTAGHTIYPYQTALELIAEEVSANLKHHTHTGKPKDNNAEIKNIHNLREKIQAGYESGLYTTAEASTRLAALETQVNKLQNEQQKRAAQNLARLDLLKHMDTTPDMIRAYILKGDPTQVNRFLQAIITSITITPKKEVLIEWI